MSQKKDKRSNRDDGYYTQGFARTTRNKVRRLKRRVPWDKSAVARLAVLGATVK